MTPNPRWWQVNATHPDHRSHSYCKSFPTEAKANAEADRLRAQGWRAWIIAPRNPNPTR